MKYIRVRDERTGHAYTVPANTKLVEGVRPMPGAPAIDRNGRPLPPSFGHPKPPKAKGADMTPKETITSPAKETGTESKEAA